MCKDRFWQPTSSAILTGNLSEDALSNQLFSTNHRLGFLGQVLKSQLSWIESIEIATEHNINMNVLLSDVGEVLSSTREAIRIRRWEEFESFISYSFGLEVR